MMIKITIKRTPIKINKLFINKHQITKIKVLIKMKIVIIKMLI